MRVLLAEDDVPLSRFISKGLEAEDYAVDVVNSGADAGSFALTYDYDLMILDLNLPGVDGVKVLEKVRLQKREMPILVLTGRTKVEDRVRCLDAGADDYLTKPFAFSELSARMRALLRRQAKPVQTVLSVEDLELDRVNRTVSRAGQRIELTTKEFALLEYLMRNAGRRVTRAMIIENVWNLSFDSMTNVVDVYINYVRKKVDEGFEQKLIRTVRGVGYQLGDMDRPS